MTTMVERVARAMCEADIRWYSQRFPNIPADDIRKTAETDLADSYPILARAAIAAMRNPTRGMLDSLLVEALLVSDVIDNWQAAIDAALNESD